MSGALDVKFCSRALVMIGARPIASLSGSSAEQLVCKELYPHVVEEALSLHRWRFAVKMVTLQRVATEPLARYAAKYQLPAATQRGEVYAVLVNDARIMFDRFEQHVYCDAAEADVVIAEVKTIPAEAYWPDYFTAFVVVKLAAFLAVSLAEDSAKANVFEGMAVRRLGQAKTLDSQTRTNRKIPTGGLRRYHGGRP